MKKVIPNVIAPLTTRLENYKDFDAYLPIEEKGANEKIEWALRGCGAVITDFEIFDKDLRDKYSFELHKV